MKPIGDTLLLFDEQRTFLPKWMARGSIMAFFVVMVLVCFCFPSHIIPFRLWLFDIISVVSFFYFSNRLGKEWLHLKPSEFRKHLLLCAFVIRASFVVFIYFYNWGIYGNYWGAGTTDVTFYVPTAYTAYVNHGIDIVSAYRDWTAWKVQASDSGYMIYLLVIYFLTGGYSDVIIPLLLKAVYGAVCCLLIYKVSTRYLGAKVGRMSGIFCMLNPNLIWWCGSMMKETEMIFLLCLFLEYGDILIRTRRFSWKSVCVVLTSGAALFLFRTVLGVVAFLALFSALIFTSTRVIGWKRKLSVSIFLVVLLGLGATERIANEVHEMTDKATTAQKVDMQWRTRRAHGNEFAKYAGAAVFAPAIFTIPFPTFSYTYFEQEQIMQNAGGNFVKNITSFFVIFVLFALLLSGRWRECVLLEALLVGYLFVLVFSNFAQSGRFHMPIVPIEMIFAAYGISIFKKINRNFFVYFLFFEVACCVGWQWFKLKGQGLI